MSRRTISAAPWTALLLLARLSVGAAAGCSSDLTVAEPRQGGGRDQNGEVPSFREEAGPFEPDETDAKGPPLSDPIDASEAGDDAEAGASDAESGDGDAADGG